MGKTAILEETKVAAIVVNEKYIKDNIVDKDLSYEYILSNLNDENVLNKFYKKYLEHKINSNESYFKDENGKIYFSISISTFVKLMIFELFSLIHQMTGIN